MTEQREDQTMDDLESLVAELAARVKKTSTKHWNSYLYPYTYACDYLLQDPDVVPDDVRRTFDDWDGWMNRVTPSRIISRWAMMRGFDDEELAKVLADQYMVNERITRDV